MTKPFPGKRSESLDALRGLAILLMVLSGNIHGEHPLPAWMYHAQVGPPDFVFNPNFPGITWVDLVFPFFLFAMGMAFPFAMTKRLDAGMPRWRIALQILERGLLLTGFAIYLQHIKPCAFAAHPTAVDWLIGLLGFALLFPILLRLPASWKPLWRLLLRGGGLAGAAALMLFIRFPDGSGFSLYRSDIIIIVLANMSVFGALLWLVTRDAILPRLGVLGILLAFRLTHGVDGSWNQWIWNLTPAPWMYSFYYLQYLFIVIPGTIAGDLVYRWTRSTDDPADRPADGWRSVMILGLMILAVSVNLAGLFTRALVATAIADGVLCVLALWLTNDAETSLARLHRALVQWGSYWLLLGICFEAFEGGIKKDHPTLSYYFVTAGLAGFAFTGFSVLMDRFRRTRPVRLLVENGQNPMIAYIAGSNLVLPILSLTSIQVLLGVLSSSPWLGFVRGVFFTALVAIATSVFTRNRLFWRT